MTPELQQAVSPGAFEQRYRANADPWDYAHSSYERDKYRTTMEALTRDRYASAFEPACSVGELTALLSSRCDSLLATDVSGTAVARARERCADLSGVQIERADLRTQSLSTRFDLIVMSEVGYYFQANSLADIVTRLEGALLTDGELIAVHWLGHSRDHVLHGDDVHSVMLETLKLKHVRGDRYADFRLDAWLRK